MTVTMGEKWEEWDHPIYMVHNWTDVRAAIDFRIGSSKSRETYIMPNNSIA